MADEQEKFDRFKPAAPKVPGVPDPAAAPAEAAAKKGIPKQWVLLGAGGVALVLLVILVAVVLRTEPPPVSPTAPPVSDPAAAAATAAASPAATSPNSPPVAPGEIGTVLEFAEPWSAKRFVFRKFTDEYYAMVIRLPGGPQRNASGYWAFALGRKGEECELEFITDTARLAQEFGYRAQHPMVVDPCTKSVYDPLRNGDVGGAWVRGDVVKGSAYRPPLAILIKVENDRLAALQME